MGSELFGESRRIGGGVFGSENFIGLGASSNQLDYSDIKRFPRGRNQFPSGVSRPNQRSLTCS
jgi:hypothetical protein